MSQSRMWLEQAKGLADNADAAATIAQTHALLALNDRAGAILERLLTDGTSRVPAPLQQAQDDAAIDHAIALGRPETDAVLRFVRDELGVEPAAYQEQMLRRLVTASLREHPLQAADRAWFEAQKRNAVAAGDAPGIRAAVDGLNRARDDESQYASAPTAMERTWASEQEVAEVERMEATIDPDVAASNARVRREERERAAMDRQVARGTGIFGQMGAAQEEDG